MQDHKTKVVKELTKGIEFLFRKNKVTSFKGQGRITGPGSASSIFRTGTRQDRCRRISQ